MTWVRQIRLLRLPNTTLNLRKNEVFTRLNIPGKWSATEDEQGEEPQLVSSAVQWADCRKRDVPNRIETDELTLCKWSNYNFTPFLHLHLATIAPDSQQPSGCLVGGLPGWNGLATQRTNEPAVSRVSSSIFTLRQRQAMNELHPSPRNWSWQMFS